MPSRLRDVFREPTAGLPWCRVFATPVGYVVPSSDDPLALLNEMELPSGGHNRPAAAACAGFAAVESLALPGMIAAIS